MTRSCGDWPRRSVWRADCPDGAWAHGYATGHQRRQMSLQYEWRSWHFLARYLPGNFHPDEGGVNAFVQQSR